MRRASPESGMAGRILGAGARREVLATRGRPALRDQAQQARPVGGLGAVERAGASRTAEPSCRSRPGRASTFRSAAETADVATASFLVTADLHAYRLQRSFVLLLAKTHCSLKISYHDIIAVHRRAVWRRLSAIRRTASHAGHRIDGNQQVMTSTVSRPAAVFIPAAGTYRAGHRPTIPAATRHLFSFTVHDTFGMADEEIYIADPVRESLARATISAVSFRTANPRRGPAVRSARFLAVGAYPDITVPSERVDQADGHCLVRGRCRCAGRAAGLSWRGRTPGWWPAAGCDAHGLIPAGGEGR